MFGKPSEGDFAQFSFAQEMQSITVWFPLAACKRKNLVSFSIILQIIYISVPKQLLIRGELSPLTLVVPHPSIH